MNTESRLSPADLARLHCLARLRATELRRAAMSDAMDALWGVVERSARRLVNGGRRVVPGLRPVEA